MPHLPDSPESRQIADVAINEDETIVKRPPSEGEEAAVEPSIEDAEGANATN